MSTPISCFCFPQVVQKHTLVRWELQRSFDGQSCLEYLYRKIIKIC